MLAIAVMLLVMLFCVAAVCWRIWAASRREEPLLDGWTAAFGAVGLIVALLLLSAVTGAQSTGYRYTQNGIVFVGNGSVCFEPTYNAGPDTCLYRSGVGHLSQTIGTLAVSPDAYGSATLVAGTKTVTFANAFTVAPVCLVTWNGSGTFTTGASLKCVTTTTTAVITSSTGTDTAVVNYEIVPNPN